jgi:hypothetical protein
LAFIWPFSPFEILAFFETAYGQIWPFYFLGPGNPAPKSIFVINGSYSRIEQLSRLIIYIRQTVVWLKGSVEKK